jgi:HEAT repeat protein
MQELPKSVKIKVVDVIERIPSRLTVKQCLVLLKDSDADVRARVTEALATIGKSYINLLIPAMKDSDGNVQTGAKDALVAIGPEVIPLVKKAARESDLRSAAFDVLIRIGEPSIPAIISLLHDPDQDVRMAAADALAKINGPDGKPSRKGTVALLQATKDKAAVRRVAISSLCTICDPRATDLLVDVLAHTRDDGEVRARAARALSVIGGEKAIAALTNALGDWDLKVRTSVITGLQTMGEVVVQPVMSAIASGSTEVRRAGASVLEKIDSPIALKALLQLAGDKDPVIRASVARGLGYQTSNVRSDVLIAMLADPDGTVADTAADVLARLASDGNVLALNGLVGVLESSADYVVKYRAADALARVGKPAADPLVRCLDKGGSCTKFAVYALGRIRDPRTKVFLRRFVAVNDPDLAWVAKRALANM